MTVKPWPWSPMIAYVREVQDRTQLSISELAAAIGTSRTNLMGVVAGTRRLSLKDTIKLYALMGQGIESATIGYMEQPAIPPDKRRSGKPVGRPKKKNEKSFKTNEKN